MLSSVNSEQTLEFDLNYKDLDVNEDETPNIIIHHTVATKTKQKDLFIKINGIEYNVEINEILKNNGNENPLISLGKTYSYFISFFAINESTNRSVSIKLPINKFTKFVNSKLINGKFLFKISCIISYEIYFHRDDYYYLRAVKQSPSIFMHSSQLDYRVEPSNEQISLIIEKNKYTGKLQTELPLLDEPINNQSLADAIENLKLAAEGFIEGNFSSIILNTRNAIANNLTELDNPNSPKKKRTILKRRIKEACLSNVPAKDKDDYKDILNHVGNVAASLLKIIHKYAHENQNTIRMRPLHADLELIYFSASIVAKYLTILNNTEF